MSNARQHLVLIPGSLCDERVWHYQVEALGDVAEISIPSLHGHDSLVSIAEAVLETAPDRFALAGFSMGGRVALEMYRLAPESVTRLALIGSSVHPVAEGEAERRQPQITKAREEGMATLAAWWNPKIAHPSRRDDASFMGLLESMACTFSPEDYENEVRALVSRPDSRDLLDRITVPSLILAGADDPLSTPDRNFAMAASIPGARLVIVEGAGHFPMLENPTAVTAALGDWLAA